MNVTVKRTGVSLRLKKLGKEMWRHRILYLMILLPMSVTFIFNYIPIYGIQIAFKDYRTRLGILGSEWVGMKHFINFFNYPNFWEIVWNTLWINIVSLCTFPLPIIFALMLNEVRLRRLKKFCQTVTYAPYFVSTVVVCSMATMFMQTDGLFNIIGGFLGLPKGNLLQNPSAFAGICAVIDLWQGLGWNSIIYLAVLANVSPELIEAAKIDGATRMQIIKHVNLPALKPTIITLFILRMGSMFSVGFEKIFLLQNPLNLDASTTISTYVYEVGLKNQQFSYSTAIGLFESIVNIILIVSANTISKKVAKSGLW